MNSLKHISFRNPSLLAGFVLVSLAASAQDTATIKKREVKVTSTFKPVLKEAAKINLNPTPPTADTTRPRLQYQVPNQNLQFRLQPGSLKPLALKVDTGGRWDNESYIKAGYGSLKTPFLQAGLSVGDGKTTGMNLYAKHISSQGKRAYQDFSNTNVEAKGFLQTGNIEWNGSLGTDHETYYKYGFQPDSLKFSEDSLKVKFTTWKGRVSFHNINRTAYDISYAPEVKVDVFNDRLKNSESNTYIYLPVRKTVGRIFEVDAAAEVNLTRFKPKDSSAINNNFVVLSPSVLFKTPNAFIQAGIKPSWNNGAFTVFPNVLAEFSIPNKQFTVQLGWTGWLRNSGFQYTAGQNPWIYAPATIKNTRVEERYIGLKGSVGDHLNFSAKAAFNKLNDQPLFLNDSLTGKSFNVVYESQMKVIHLGGEMGITVGERFSLISNLAVNKFTNLKDNSKAWGLLRTEFTTKARVQAMKDLYLTADLFAFDGPWYRDRQGDGNRQKGALDLGAGAEFKVYKNLKVWAQFNNLLNKEYQRWNQYPVYGFNLMGGIVFSFAQKHQ
ncbi:hypothetical protein V9K67_19330 [Paraflavisolibacter sp. H34]|uniref:hypothetical protein n=1 Tax=Huijunlia imazamoxiresistens TaxID=3127457 RepID=UPI0030198CBC